MIPQPRNLATQRVLLTPTSNRVMLGRPRIRFQIGSVMDIEASSCQNAAAMSRLKSTDNDQGRGARISYIRTKILKTTHEKLAKMLGVSIRSVFRYQQGYRPHEKALTKLSELSGRTKSWIRYGGS